MTSVNAAAPSRPLQPIVTITTLKNWVLPPRPKNARKSKVVEKKKKPLPAIAGAKPGPKVAAGAMRRSTSMPASASPATPRLDSVDDLHSSIRAIDRENYHLKTRLLSLIHDYKSLRALVLRATSDDSPQPLLYDGATTARKRLYTEMGDPMSELIVNMNELSHTSPQNDLAWDLEPLATPVEPLDAVEPELFDFVNLDSDFDDLDDPGPELADMDDDLDSRSLTRSISPSASEMDENLLMASLTRSTTVSTNNSTWDRKPLFKFYDLPSYSEDNFRFSFEKVDPHDKMMSVIEEDHYNQVADFLEEKLMSNDVKYYVEKNLLDGSR